MRRLLALLFSLLFIEKLSAQRNLVDSIKSLIGKSKADTIRVKYLLELAEIFRISPDLKNIDSAVYYGNQSLTLAKEIDDKRGEGRSLIVLGKSSRYETDPIKAIEYFKNALLLSEKIKDTLGIIMGLNGYALLYYYKSDYRQELSYYLKVEDLARRISNAYELRFAFGRIGKTYFILGQIDSAEYYLQQAISLKLDEEDPFSISHMGRLRMHLRDYKNAIQYFRRALSIYSKKNDKFRIAQCYYDIARLYEEQEKLDSALYNYKLSYENGSQIRDSLYTIEGVGSNLAQLYEKRNNLTEALRYYKLSTSARDRLKDDENLSKLLDIEYKEKERKREIEVTNAENLNKVKLTIALSAAATILIFCFFLYRNNLSKRKTNMLLNKQKGEIEKAFSELKLTQAQLIQSEKMASLGELTAGIAHEIQNPLNFVNNFSEVSNELLVEAEGRRQEAGENSPAVAELLLDIKHNLEKINHHGKRADAIVKGMMQHSHSNAGEKEPTDINVLADQYLRLAYQGMRGKENSFNVSMKTDFDQSVGKINVIPQDIGRVLLNLYSNSFYVLSEKMKTNPGFSPEFSITTHSRNGKVELAVKDNGGGIPEKIVDKIFQPFFTTKPTGQGTGLGLSLAYDIIKAHQGEINLMNSPGEGVEFILTLPLT